MILSGWCGCVCFCFVDTPCAGFFNLSPRYTCYHSHLFAWIINFWSFYIHSMCLCVCHLFVFIYIIYWHVMLNGGVFGVWLVTIGVGAFRVFYLNIWRWFVHNKSRNWVCFNVWICLARCESHTTLQRIGRSRECVCTLDDWPDDRYIVPIPESGADQPNKSQLILVIIC